MPVILSVDLMISDEHSADAIYQDCLYNSFQDKFQLVSSSSYETSTFYCENILIPILNKNIFSKLLSLLKNAVILFKKVRHEKNAILIFQSFFASEIIIVLLFTLFNRIIINRSEYQFVFIMRFEFSKIQMKILETSL